MDASRFIGAVFLALSVILRSTGAQAANDTNPSAGFICPLMDFPDTVNSTIIHNITRTKSCVNGREMAGCCVSRLYCNFYTSNIDISLYGPPGFRFPCSDICCPQNYILPIPLPGDDQGTDTSVDASDNIVDDSSDSDENEQK